jgi:hypothetical protein
MMIYENPLMVDSGDSILSSTGLWAPSATGNTVSDPLAGTRAVSTSARPLVFIRIPVTPGTQST